MPAQGIIHKAKAYYIWWSINLEQLLTVCICLVSSYQIFSKFLSINLSNPRYIVHYLASELQNSVTLGRWNALIHPNRSSVNLFSLSVFKIPSLKSILSKSGLFHLLNAWCPFNMVLVNKEYCNDMFQDCRKEEREREWENRSYWSKLGILHGYISRKVKKGERERRKMYLGQLNCYAVWWILIGKRKRKR